MTIIRILIDFYPTRPVYKSDRLVHYLTSRMTTDINKGILCTIDFSDGSIAALKWAIKFSRELGCNLTILFAYRLSKNVSEEVVAWKKKMETDAKEKFTVLENAYLSGTHLKYEFRTEVGFVSDRIEEYSKKNPFSFLVMDRNMCTKSKDTFEELMEHLNVPLIIIPNN